MPIPLRIVQLFAALGALALAACETSTRALPQYEARLNPSEFQTVRTTAYTHTESDHRQFSNHNALGGELRAASPAIRRAENARSVGASNSDASLQPFSMEPPTARPASLTVAKGYDASSRDEYGSAAADWSRWPAGTVFRLLSTGQVYRVDDYGWALAGRNTIDLYMASPRDMNGWGVRQESIQVLKWGDRQQSLRYLGPHQEHRHIKRMILELEGRDQEAAQLH